MYGLVNQALEDFVREGFGDAAWNTIRDGAGVSQDMFVSMDSYPDYVTYKLVGVAAEVLGLDAAQILERFGEHWVLYTAQAGYGEMLAMFGSDLRAFLFNLDYGPKGGDPAVDDNVLFSILAKNGAPRPAFDALSLMPKP